MILCSLSLCSLTNMAAHLSALLILSGLSGQSGAAFSLSFLFFGSFWLHLFECQWLNIFLGFIAALQSGTTARKYSVKVGGSISVPCPYEPEYKNRVKYLCEGYYWDFCSYKVKSKTTSRSGEFSISDNKQENIFTVTIDAKTVGTHYYWCAVEIKNGNDIGNFFELSVTKGKKL